MTVGVQGRGPEDAWHVGISDRGEGCETPNHTSHALCPPGTPVFFLIPELSKPIRALGFSD